MTFRIGHGYDLHRLEPLPPEGDGRPFVLAGVNIEHNRGPVGHSDGDAVYHAVVDAICGAIGAPDIGQQFPDDDPAWDAADSSQFMHAAAGLLCEAGYEISNIDITIICERPKISPHKSQMVTNIAKTLQCNVSQINLKGKTHEQVDAVGEGRAVEVHVVALIHSHQSKQSG